MSREPTLWERRIEENPGHSQWYIERFRKMAANGADLVGEARLVDAMVGRCAHILDAGCGPGRHAGYLHRQGHRVVGVDVDPALIEAAEADFSGPRYFVCDLAELDLPSMGVAEPFDLIYCAGNVITFAAPSTQPQILERFRSHLAPEGRAVVGFGAGRGYGFGEFLNQVGEAGLRTEGVFSTWDLLPFVEGGDFMVAVLRAC